VDAGGRVVELCDAVDPVGDGFLVEDGHEGGGDHGGAAVATFAVDDHGMCFRNILGHDLRFEHLEERIELADARGSLVILNGEADDPHNGGEGYVKRIRETE